MAENKVSTNETKESKDKNKNIKSQATTETQNKVAKESSLQTGGDEIPVNIENNLSKSSSNLV